MDIYLHILNMNGGGYKDFKTFVHKKLKRLIIPYFFVSLLWVIPFQIYFFGINMKNYFCKYVLGIAPSQLWFLLMLFFVFLIIFYVSDWLYYEPKQGIIICSILYFVGILLTRFVPNIFQIFTAMQYLLFFYLGMLMEKYDFFSKKHKSLMLFVVDISLFFLYMCLSSLNKGFIKIILIFLKLLLNIAGSLMIIVLIKNLINQYSDLLNSKIFKIFKNKTFIVYLLHQQIIYCVINVLNGLVCSTVLVLSNFIISIIGSLIIGSLLTKFKFGKLIFGMK